MSQKNEPHIPALRYRWLTRFYEGMSYALPFPDNTFDLVVSSLFFYHLTAVNKQRTLAEVRRVLSANGRYLVCDWGKPANPALRLTFYLVQMLDGFGVTRDNALGRLPGFISDAGFKDVTVVDRVSTMLGTLDLITAKSA